MSCGCGCQNCGNETPRVSGTEVTLLSGLSNKNQVRANGETGEKPKSGAYAVAGVALVVALVAAYSSCKRGS
ncbi:MAG: hypothetical protein ACXAEN_17060 [Candidatus Thorarchaeota archaeon]|jgi:hypothetical protein